MKAITSDSLQPPVIAVAIAGLSLLLLNWIAMENHAAIQGQIMLQQIKFVVFKTY